MPSLVICIKDNKIIGMKNGKMKTGTGLTRTPREETREEKNEKVGKRK